MSINPYGRGAYRSSRPESFVSTRSQLDELQRQLVTKQKSETYGGLGVERRTSLDLNAKVAKINSWIEGIERADVNTSLSLSAVEGYSDIVADFAKLTANSRSDANGGLYTPDASGRSVSQNLAGAQLTQTIDLLNTQVNGRYLFSGRTSDVLPVLSGDTLLNGDGAGKVGLRALIDERKEADLGTGLGRLIAGGATTLATLSEEATTHPYGFKITGSGTSSAALVPTLTAGPPADLSIDVVGTPLAGEILTIQLTLPDKSVEQIQLKARAFGTTQEADTFEIGPDNLTTAANLRAALADTVGRTARTALSAASTVLASENFFAGTLSSPPLRVPGPGPFAAVTAAPTPASVSDTVIWYAGDDATNPGPRETATVQVGENQTVSIGARANEKAFQLGLAQFAAFAAETFLASDADAAARYIALADRVNGRVRNTAGADKPGNLITELGTAQKLLANAKDRNIVAKGYLETTLDKVEGVTTEEVAAQILQLQTQLQATYEVTSVLSKLSLVNYL